MALAIDELLLERERAEEAARAAEAVASERAVEVTNLFNQFALE